MKKIILTIAALGVLLVSGYANAAKYDIKKMTPQVQQALENRRARFDQLRSLKISGIVGENNRGYVEILKNDPKAKSLVEAENKDRKLIYQTIAEQNNLQNELKTIEQVFSQVQRDKAESGDAIQTESGEWIRK